MHNIARKPILAAQHRYLPIRQVSQTHSRTDPHSAIAIHLGVPKDALSESVGGTVLFNEFSILEEPEISKAGGEPKTIAFRVVGERYSKFSENLKVEGFDQFSMPVQMQQS